MRTFTDSTGRTWTLAITVDAIKRVESLVKVNLARLLEPRKGSELPLLTELESDIILLCDVLFALVKSQADAQGVSDEQFGQALGGEAIAAAYEAFWEELVGFFQKLPHGKATVTAIRKHRELIEAQLKAAQDKIEALGGKGDRKNSGTAPPPAIPGNSAGSSRASLGSIPDPSRSGSSPPCRKPRSAANGRRPPP
ncbi:MAG: hypothetical protein KJ057_09825 [Phycisphaerae bacterium]|nr:MAG: hypothetical protein EDS66_15920 [Planctomycetota bacterium]MBE7458209.1 hypothetical protein [Planctomycetia bacterium]MCL4718756.1 hypothetical protein [Phycisphaerae bacterium]